MALTRYKQLPHSIKDFFEKTTQKVFSIDDIDSVYIERFSGILAASTTEKFAKQVVQANILKAKEFEFSAQIKPQIRFWTKKADIFDIAVTLMPNAHLSHNTALYLHGMLEQHPKSIYVTSEQSKKHFRQQTNELEQDNVDYAFSKTQRLSNLTCNMDKYKIIALRGMGSDDLGVINLSGKQTTSLERTLLDVTVRPGYAGGVFGVLNAYIKAKERIDTRVLFDYLNTINYTYPYHQCIGFYLEKAGYKTSQISCFEIREKCIDFYLDYAMTDPAYSEKWRLYFPKELQ